MVVFPAPGIPIRKIGLVVLVVGCRLSVVGIGYLVFGGWY
jgi:hypothetical protein